MKQIIQADKINYKQVFHQLRFDWLCSILSETGMNLDNCFPESGNIEDQTINQKAQLRSNLKDNDILIVDSGDDSLIIYIQKQIIAEWKKPLYIRKEDLEERNQRKKFYIEIHIEYDSVFDQDDVE